MNRLSTGELQCHTSTQSESNFIMSTPSFWQVHSSVTVISPLLRDMDSQRMSMKFKSIHRPPKKNTLALAENVNQLLGNVFEEVDRELEAEWDISRHSLQQSLLH
ncbi:hypothetical protein BDB01DRAFT_771799 [Pilobolus umbonatus]|nr:hypothetical protein BDB01DRAFT_771799 [Pilobolus umbonatus]